MSNITLSNVLATAAQNTLGPNPNDRILKKGAKFVTRIPVNTAISAVALVQTVAFAILTALSTVTLIATKKVFNGLSSRTKAAGEAALTAFKGIAGYYDQKAIDFEASETEDDVTITDLARELLDLGKEVAKTAYNNKGKVALSAAALAGAAGVAYYGPQASYTYLKALPGNIGSATLEKLTQATNTFKSYIPEIKVPSFITNFFTSKA